jgi:hypothetical protein
MLMTISMMQQSVTDEEHQNHNKKPHCYILQNYILLLLVHRWTRMQLNDRING